MISPIYRARSIRRTLANALLGTTERGRHPCCCAEIEWTVTSPRYRELPSYIFTYAPKFGGVSFGGPMGSFIKALFMSLPLRLAQFR
jgi:hypothetical protein